MLSPVEAWWAGFCAQHFDSPDLRFAGSPSLRLRRKEGLRKEIVILNAVKNLLLTLKSEENSSMRSG